ncbi:MAG: hypothetical protein UH625_09480 [Muribaculaceae bacterium]|nr:hypothetical protein [Muribaculaceae bacterium]
MTDELLEKATRLRSEIERLKHDLKDIEYWGGHFKRMTADHYIIPDELKEEVTRYVTETLKERYTKELEGLEKEFLAL